MRLGVSGKIFLAYTVLLLAFTANATFTLVVIHRARQGVVANEAYLDLQGSVDAAWKSLNDFAPSLGRNLRLDPNLALGLRMTRACPAPLAATSDSATPSSFRPLGSRTVPAVKSPPRGRMFFPAAAAGTVTVSPSRRTSS